MTELRKCPACDGRGIVTGYGCPGFKIITIICDICKEARLIRLEDYQPERGKAMKQDRIARKLTLREEAKRVGLHLGELSRQERGYFG